MPGSQIDVGNRRLVHLLQVMPLCSEVSQYWPLRTQRYFLTKQATAALETAPMAPSLDQVAKDARVLSRDEKAILARLLLEDLDQDIHVAPPSDVDDAWLKEARRRFDAYRSGELPAIPADQALKAARLALR